MKVDIRPGKYVIAVSGGVDSVVLLDLLSRQKTLDLIVAHFDHGIRPRSHEDHDFVADLADQYDLAFFSEEGRLGASASEAQAREARYKFLREIQKINKADAIITAHHEDDVIETALINILRGTSAKGLGALKSTDEIMRPLLSYDKSAIIDYAKKNELKWVEDPSNEDEKYLRNYVRKNITPKFSEASKQNLLDIIKESANTTDEIGQILTSILPKTNTIRRSEITKMPHSVALEYLAGWLSDHELRVDKKTLNRLVISLKTARRGAVLDINKSYIFEVKKDLISLKPK